MERFYRALRVLSVAALALVLLASGYTFYTMWPPLRFSSMETTPLLHGLSAVGDQTLYKLSSMLGPGACIMGIVLAWLDRRKRWFAALLIATGVTYLFPVVVDAWPDFDPNRQIPFLDFSSESGVIYITIEEIAPLIALALTLVFTRTTQERVMVDADLGLSRSTI